MPKHTIYDTEGNLLTSADNRSLEEAKAEALHSLKDEAKKKLNETDWYVSRAMEDPTKPVPASIAAVRAAVRAVCDTIEAQIVSAATNDEVDSISWGGAFSEKIDALAAEEEKVGFTDKVKPKPSGGVTGDLGDGR